jgi:hypothetical protein
MRRILVGCCLPTLLLTASVAPRAAAQSRYPRAARLAIGQAATGSLAAGDSVHDGRLLDVWAFQATEGEVIEVTLESEDFDPRLALGERSYRFLENDNGDDEGRGSRIEFAIPADGEYLIAATSAGVGGRGRYVVRLARPSWADGVGTRRVLRFGALVDGRLADGDAAAEGSHYQDHLYTAAQGESTSFKLTSPDFDSYLSIGRMVDGRFRELASDDDSGGGVDSRLAVTFPDAGVWLVRVSNVLNSRLGDYRLEAGSLMPVLTRTGSQAGQISDHDARLADGVRYDEYQYLAQQGETVVIEAASHEFAPVVLVGQDGDAGFEVLTESDHGSTSARLQYTFRKAGDYFVRVSHASPSGRGRYTLRVR